MLPTELSTDLTSLNEDQERLAVVADMGFEEDGTLAESDLYRAGRNHAKLACRSVAAWLVGERPPPQRIPETGNVLNRLRSAGFIPLQAPVCNGYQSGVNAALQQFRTLPGDTGF